jgi:hypothetical protein
MALKAWLKVRVVYANLIVRLLESMLRISRKIVEALMKDPKGIRGAVLRRMALCMSKLVAALVYLSPKTPPTPGNSHR